jgi:hypothetical protein
VWRGERYRRRHFGRPAVHHPHFGGQHAGGKHAHNNDDRHDFDHRRRRFLLDRSLGVIGTDQRVGGREQLVWLHRILVRFGVRHERIQRYERGQSERFELGRRDAVERQRRNDLGRRRHVGIRIGIRQRRRGPRFPVLPAESRGLLARGPDRPRPAPPL